MYAPANKINALPWFSFAVETLVVHVPQDANRFLALEWSLHLSDHRPLLVGRQAPHHLVPEHRPLRADALSSPAFCHQVHLGYQLFLSRHPDSPALRRWAALKQVIRRVGSAPPGPLATLPAASTADLKAQGWPPHLGERPGAAGRALARREGGVKAA